MKPKLKITLAEIDLIKKPFSIMNELITEAVLNIETDRISLVMMDPANVAMVIWNLYSSACTEWDCEPQRLCIRLEDAKQMLKSATKFDVLSIEHNKDEEKLDFVLRGKSVRRYSLPLVQNEDKDQKIPELSFKAKIVMPSDTFAEQINEACNISNSIQFSAEHNKLFDLTATGNINKLNIENRDVEIYAENPTSCKYSLEYLKQMVKAKDISKDVIIQFSEQYPLMLTYKQLDKTDMIFILAPKVEM